MCWNYASGVFSLFFMPLEALSASALVLLFLVHLFVRTIPVNAIGSYHFGSSCWWCRHTSSGLHCCGILTWFLSSSPQCSILRQNCLSRFSYKEDGETQST